MMRERGDRSRARAGFAMLAVLWAIVVVSTLVLATALTGRDAFSAGRNRVSSSRAYWFANDCAERARAAIDSALRRSDVMAARTWRDLEAVVLHDPLVAHPSCVVDLEAAGTRLDVNTASAEEIHRLFTAAGRLDADDVTDALIDWRDDDQQAGANGAELPWYAQQDRAGPRNGPLADVDETTRVRGLEDGRARALLTVEPGPISIATASGPVLAALPGFTEETIEAVLAMRERGAQVEDLLALASSLSSAARDSLVMHYQEVAQRATLDPEAWIITASGWSGFPAVTVSLELRIVRTDRRAAVVRTRVRS